MITDEELTSELTRALRSGTDHVAYTGKVPRAHRSIAVTVAPLAATTAAAAVLGWSALTAGAPTAGSAPDGATATTAGPARSEAARPESRVVTDQIELAGLTFTYTRGVDDAPFGGECRHGEEPTKSCYVALWSPREQIPASAEKFDVDGTTVWVAEDPDTGLAGLYLQADGSIIAILSEERTLEQMRELAGTLQVA